jgi:hypothetical protein
MSDFGLAPLSHRPIMQGSAFDWGVSLFTRQAYIRAFLTVSCGSSIAIVSLVARGYPILAAVGAAGAVFQIVC